MRRIYEPRDLLEAELLLAMLASEGIRAHLLGRDLLGAVGELPLSGLLALQVTDEQAPRAQQLIAAYNSALPEAADWATDCPASQPGSLLC